MEVFSLSPESTFHQRVVAGLKFDVQKFKQQMTFNRVTMKVAVDLTLSFYLLVYGLDSQLKFFKKLLKFGVRLHKSIEKFEKKI